MSALDEVLAQLNPATSEHYDEAVAELVALREALADGEREVEHHRIHKTDMDEVFRAKQARIEELERMVRQTRDLLRSVAESERGRKSEGSAVLSLEHLADGIADDLSSTLDSLKEGG